MLASLIQGYTKVNKTQSWFYWLVVAEVKPTALFLRVRAPQSSWCRNRKTTWDMLNTSNITGTFSFGKWKFQCRLKMIAFKQGNIYSDQRKMLDLVK